MSIKIEPAAGTLRRCIAACDTPGCTATHTFPDVDPGVPAKWPGNAQRMLRNLAAATRHQLRALGWTSVAGRDTCPVDHAAVAPLTTADVDAAAARADAERQAIEAAELDRMIAEEEAAQRAAHAHADDDIEIGVEISLDDMAAARGDDPDFDVSDVTPDEDPSA